MSVDEQAREALAALLADEGWCCDPYGHEDGPPAPGECSECDRLREQTADAILAVGWRSPGEVAQIEAERDRLAAAVARVAMWCVEQDRLSKGESPTTAAVRAALAAVSPPRPTAGP